MKFDSLVYYDSVIVLLFIVFGSDVLGFDFDGLLLDDIVDINVSKIGRVGVIKFVRDEGLIVK